MRSESFLLLGDFSYYPKNQKLLDKKGAELKLRPQSLAVLHLLAAKPNEVVSKDEIFQTVWPDVVVSDDSLVQCVGDIRRALGDDKHKILQTVPRRGYKLVASASAEQAAAKYSHQSTGDNSISLYQRLAVFRSILPLMLIALVAVVSWFIVQDEAPEQVAADPPPSLFLDIFSDETSAQAKRVETETKVALGRYRTISLANSEDADYHLTLEIDEQQVTAELTDTADDAIFFLDSFSLSEDKSAANNAGVRIAAAIASPGGGAVGRRLLAQSRDKPVAALKRQECYSHAYNCPTCSGEEDTLTQRSKICIANILEDDPNDALAWALNATILTRQLWFGVALSEKQRNNRELIERLPVEALEAAKKAEALSDGDDSGVYWGMAQAYVASCELDKLEVAINRGLEINPDDPHLLAPFGNWLGFSGSWEKGNTLSRRALELEPRKYKLWWWQGIAKGHFHRQEYDEASANPADIKNPV